MGIENKLRLEVNTAKTSSLWLHAGIHYLKCSLLELKCAINIRYTPDFEDLAQQCDVSFQ